MKYHRMMELIEEGEGLRVEFKRKVSSPEKIAKEMIAFANTSGGVILFGVDDDREIIGVESEKGEMEFILQAARDHVEPSINVTITIFNVENKDVICVEVPASGEAPHYLINDPAEDDGQPKAYIRIGENSVAASREMTKILKHRAGKEKPVRLIIGEPEKRLFSFLEENERITVKEYARIINISERRASRLLVRLVKAGVLAIHTSERQDFFTIMRDLSQ